MATALKRRHRSEILAKKKQEEVDPVVKELMDIKRLLIVALLKDGMQQGTIAATLGVSDATISLMFPKGMTKALKSSG